MSDFHDDPEHEGDEPADGSSAIKQMRQQIKTLTKELHTAKEGSARAAELERKLALTEMGANLKDPRAKYLPVTDDVDQLREAAIDLGLVAPPEPDVPADEEAAHERVAAASAGGRSVPGGNAVTADQIAGMSQQEVIAWAAAQGKLEVQ
jgi:hypothetical protein